MSIGPNPDPSTDGKVYLLSSFGVIADGTDYSTSTGGMKSKWQAAIDTASGFTGNLPGPLVMDALTYAAGGMPSGSAMPYVVSTTLLVKAPLTLLGVANPGLGSPKILVRTPLMGAVSKAPQQGADPFTVFFVNDVTKRASSVAGVIFRDFDVAYDEDYFPLSGPAFHFVNVSLVEMARIKIDQCWSGVLCDGTSGIRFSNVVANPCQSTTVSRSRRFGFKCSSAAVGNANGATLENCQCPGNTSHTADGFVIANGFDSMNTLNCGAQICDRAFASTIDGGTVVTTLSMPLTLSPGPQMLKVNDPIVPTFVPVLVTDVTAFNSFVGLVVATGDTLSLTVDDIIYINTSSTGSFAPGSYDSTGKPLGTFVTAELVGFLTTATTGPNGPYAGGDTPTIALGHATPFSLFSSIVLSDGTDTVTGVIVGIGTSGNKIVVLVSYSTSGALMTRDALI